jgi:excisionase family DNA binding protein
MSAQATPEPTTALLTPVDVARIANVSLFTVRREIERGALPARHVGRQLRIDPAEFQAYLNGAERGSMSASYTDALADLERRLSEETAAARTIDAEADAALADLHVPGMPSSLRTSTTTPPRC